LHRERENIALAIAYNAGMAAGTGDLAKTSLGRSYTDLDAIGENGTITKRVVLANHKMSRPKRSIADWVACDAHVSPLK
jgi:hypothetical protein